MAWNEPGGNNNDPWGGGGKRGNDGPPDLDEALKNLQKKLSAIFGGGKGGNGGGSGSGSGFSSSIIVVILLIVGIAYGAFGFYQVDEQEQAVVLRFGTYQSTKGSGLQWNFPLIDTVFIEKVTQVREWSSVEQMLTEDLNIVDIRLSVQYTVAEIEKFVLKVRDPENSLQQAANSALRHVVGSMVMDDVLTIGRAALAAEVQTRLQDYLNSYTTGINIETVNVEDANPPRQVQQAFDDVIEAREDEERFKNEAQADVNKILPQAEAQARRIVEEATAYKGKVIAEAEGEAQRFQYLLAEYKKAPEVTRQRLYLEAVQEVMARSSKIMVDVEGGNNMMYLPLDKLGSGSSVPGMSSSGRSGSVPLELSSDQMEEISRLITEKLRRELSSNSRRREVRP